MRHEDVAEGAVVHGRVLATGSPRELETIRAKADEIGAMVFAAGDTDCGPGLAIVGVLVASAPADETAEVSHQLLRDAAEQYARLDLSVLDEHTPGVVIACDDDEQEREVSEGTFLVCWAPRAEVVLSVGRAVDDEEDERDARRDIASTEPTGCRPIDLSERALARYRAAAPTALEPELTLTVRYD